MVMSQMQLQHDVSEIKTSIVECARQVRLVENWVATGAPGRLPMTVSRGHATLVDATGREHNMLLDQCQYFDQLDAMLPVILFQCRPDEAEIQRWYIENKQYDFVMYDKNDSDVIQLTRESAIWSTMQPGTRIVMRVITEEIVDSTVTATYECPCGTPNTVHVSTGGAVAALQRGCTITCASDDIKSCSPGETQTWRLIHWKRVRKALGPFQKQKQSSSSVIF
ncbi:hypothetical protein OG21DRAFT_393802 [Imleria badia]|nr:hypothetical protein OG21DRAFT_393802 [Imleria badia]